MRNLSFLACSLIGLGALAPSAYAVDTCEELCSIQDEEGYATFKDASDTQVTCCCLRDSDTGPVTDPILSQTLNKCQRT